MPSIYRFIYAQINSVDIQLMQMNRLSVAVSMKLVGNPSLMDQLFVKEGWKGMHLTKVLEESDIMVMDKPAPILVVRPQRWLRIAPETLSLSIGGQTKPVTLSDRHELIGTPMSDPPPSSHNFSSEAEPRGSYSYYGGKFTSIYGQLALDEDYLISFDVEAVNPLYSLDFFFPYRYVDLQSVQISNSPDQGVHAASPVYGIAKPMVSDQLTPEYEYKLNRPEDEYPEFEKAEPFRNTPPIIAPEEVSFKSIDRHTIYPINLDDYKIISIQFMFAFIQEQLPHKLIVQPKVTDRAIPIRTYEQMQRLPEYRDFLVQMDIFNTDRDNERVLEVESEIIGYTEKASETIIVPKLDGENGPARKVITQCPELKAGILELMSGPAEADLVYRVYETKNEEKLLVASGRKKVRLLSNEQIIWSLKDVTSGATYNLEPTLISWIDPRDKEGKLDEVRFAANDYHPNRKLRGNEDGKATLEEQTQDIKALYDCLNQKYGIEYGEHPFDYGFQYSDPLTAQRVLTAPQVLERKNGVCIDFVILFASLMEGLGINPLLIVSETHAILGWGDHKSGDTKIEDLGFLETIKLGEKDENGSFVSFELAEATARNYFKENFMFRNDSSVKMGLQVRFGRIVVDLEDARKEGAITKQ